MVSYWLKIALHFFLYGLFWRVVVKISTDIDVEHVVFEFALICFGDTIHVATICSERV